MDKLAWCKKQKTGIQIVESNDNLCEEYIKKAENSLRAVKSLEDNPEWQISSAYYAMYFSIYAILMKVGIKCEIHSCTLEIVKNKLKQYFSSEDIFLLEKSLSARIDVQYYVDRVVDKKFQDKMTSEASSFYSKCLEVIANMGEDEILLIRQGFN